MNKKLPQETGMQPINQQITSNSTPNQAALQNQSEEGSELNEL